jgi:hypothetical protein
MDDPNQNPHGAWDAMVAAAVLGTDRAGQISAAPGDLAFATRDGGKSDALLLSAAAALNAYLRAGAAPVSLADPAPATTSPPAGRLPGLAAAHQLVLILRERRDALLAEWCDLARRGGYAIPPQVLPSLLTRAQQEPKLRPLIEPILGPRGQWLAEQNPAWRGLFVESAADADSLWQTATLAQRQQLLRGLATSDRAKARSLIESTWDQDSPDDRAKFLAILVAAPAAEDEPLLERALDDKRKAVRDEAAVGLARLIGSAFAARMRERLAPLVSFNAGGKSGKGRKSSPLEITLPPEPDAAAKRDGLLAKARDGMGPQAAVLADVVAATPLGFWRQFSAPPPTWIEAAVAGEFAHPLLDGLQRAAVRQGDADWAEALARAALASSRSKKPLEQLIPIQQLLSILPPHRAEGIVLDALADKADKTGAAIGLLEFLRFPWGEALSRAALAWVRGRKLENDYGVRYWLNQSAGLRIHPSLASEASGDWPDDLPPATRQAIDQFLLTLQFRNDMHKELKP